MTHFDDRKTKEQGLQTRNQNLEAASLSSLTESTNYGIQGYAYNVGNDSGNTQLFTAEAAKINIRDGRLNIFAMTVMQTQAQNPELNGHTDKDLNQGNTEPFSFEANDMLISSSVATVELVSDKDHNSTRDSGNSVEKVSSFAA